jgi:hypothetical protein
MEMAYGKDMGIPNGCLTDAYKFNNVGYWQI